MSLLRAVPTRLAARLAVASIVVAGVPALTAGAAHAADTTAPSLLSARLQPGLVDVTKAPTDVAVTVHATDDVGVTSVSLTLSGPAGSDPINQSVVVGDDWYTDAVFQAGSRTDGWWTTRLSIPQSTAPGTWHLTSVTLGDGTNEGTTDGAALAGLPSPTQLALQVQRQPHTGADQPAVSALSVVPATVDTTSDGGQAEVRFRATDPVDGIASGMVTLVDSSDPTSTWDEWFSVDDRASGTPYDGTYAVPVSLPQSSSAGSTTWNVSVTATDGYGTTTAPASAGTVSQVAQADTVAPTVTSVSVAPTTGDATLQGFPVTLTVKAADAPSDGSSRSSGISSGFVTLSGPNNESVDAYFDRSSLVAGSTAQDGTFFAETWIPARAAAGSWTVSSVWVVDGYGNSSGTLPAAGPDENRSVAVSTTPDTHGATLSALQISPATRNFRYSDWYGFTGTAHVSAPDSGFDHADLVMTGPDGTTSFTMPYAFSSYSLVPGSGSITNGDFTIQLDPRWSYEDAYWNANGTSPVSDLGTYTITKVVLYDGEQAKTGVGTEITDLTGFTQALTAVDTDDSVAPSVSGVAVPATHVQIGTGDSDNHLALPVSFQDTADGALGEVASGVSDVRLTLERTDGSTTQAYGYYDVFSATGNDRAGVLTADAYFSNGDQGTWRVTAVAVTDRAGNQRSYTGADAAAIAPGTVVVDPPADTTGPVLTGLSLGSASVDSTSGATSVPVTVTGTDATGISYGYVSMTSPSGNQYAGLIGYGLECSSGTCTGELRVPQYAETGDWQVSWVSLSDRLGNNSYWDTTDLQGRPGIQSTLHVTGLTDSAPPVIGALDFDPPSTAGAPLDVTGGTKAVVANVRVTDAQSGTDWVWMSLDKADSSLYATFTRVAGDAHDGIYQASLSLPPYTSSGDYTVTLNAADSYGNSTASTGPDLTAGHYWITGLSDGTPPVVSAITAPTPVNSTAGATTAPVTVTVSDADSGFSSGYLSYLRPGDPADAPRTAWFGPSDAVAGSADTYRVQVPVPQYAPSDTWQVTAVHVEDAVGNSADVSGSQLSGLGSTTFTVTALTDSTAPQLTSLALTPTTVHIGGAEQTITATVVAAENQSGFDHGRVVLTSPDGVQQSYEGGFTASDATGAGTYSVGVVLPRNARPGTWTAAVVLVDAAGNRRDVTTADLPAGSTRTVTVDNTFDGVVNGTVTDAGSAAPVSGASVSVCTDDYYFCAPATTATDGTYSVSHLPNGGYVVLVSPPGAYESRQAVLVGQLYDLPNHTGTVDVQLTVPTPPPAGVTVPSAFDQAPGSIPTQYWEDPFVVTVTNQCHGGSGTVDVAFDDGSTATGPLTETSTAGTYTATLPKFYPHHGAATVTLHLTCPGGAGNADIPFSIYIDPSGFVLDTHGNPVTGATVTLLRSDTQAGPFVAVPNGSTVMSPSNRTNPDTTDAAGHYGWDVTAGWYKVQVSKAHCYLPGHPETTTVTSPAVNVPPAVMDLNLTLDCTNIAPTAAIADPPTGKLTNEVISFSGAGSSDANGTVFGYDWDFGDGSGHTMGVAPSHAYPTPGDYVVKLVVTDDQGLQSAPTSKVIHIGAPPAGGLVTTPGLTAAGVPTLAVSWAVAATANGTAVCIVPGSTPLAAPDGTCTDVATPTASVPARSLAKGQAYSVSVFSYQLSGATKVYAVPLTRILGGSAATVGKSGAITIGGSYTVTGHLVKAGTTTPLTGRSMRLWSRLNKSGALWTQTSVVVPTDSSGNVRTVVKPLKNTQYAWRFAGFSDGSTLDVLGVTSPVVTVSVAQKVTAKATSLKPRHGTKIYVYGTVLPKLAGQVCYLQVYRSGAWRNVTYVKTAKQKLPNGVTTIGFKLGVAPAKAGTYTYRVYRPATTVNTKGYSVKLVVRAT